MIHIRTATPADISLMYSLVHALAEYEREPESVQITEELTPSSMRARTMSQ